MEGKRGMIWYFMGITCLIIAVVLFKLWRPPNLNEASYPHGSDLKPDPHKIMNKTDMKSILHWTTALAAKRSKSHILNCKPLKCYVNRGSKNAQDYDAVVLDPRDPKNLPKIRKPNQVYVAYTWESPPHRGSFVKGNFYNWSITYMKESTLPFLHGSLIPGKAKIQIKDLPQMQKNRTLSRAIISWVVSNCYSKSRRHLYVNELKKYMPIDVFGGCGMRCLPGTGRNSGKCYDAAAQSGKYKFYLAFENSACKDYISLKPFRALQAGLVPIVFGGLTAGDYSNGILPPNSYIDVRNFTSPKHLSRYLKMLDKDDKRYLEYHSWRNNLRIGDVTLDWCDLCKKLYDEEFVNKHITIDWGEFWKPSKWCDWNLVKKVLGWVNKTHAI